MSSKPKPEKPEAVNGDPVASYIDAILTWREEGADERAKAYDVRFDHLESDMKWVKGLLSVGALGTITAFAALSANLFLKLV